MNRKVCRRRHYPLVSPVSRAVIEKAWHVDKVTHEIHVLIGSDSKKIINGAGRIYYVILGACLGQGIGADDVDVRIIRGAIEAMDDQAGEPIVDETRRLSMISGLQACNRLLQEIERHHLIDAAVGLENKLTNGAVYRSDYLALLAQPKT